jgi:hypothetical protein
VFGRVEGVLVGLIVYCRSVYLDPHEAVSLLYVLVNRVEHFHDALSPTSTETE